MTTTVSKETAIASSAVVILCTCLRTQGEVGSARQEDARKQYGLKWILAMAACAALSAYYKRWRWAPLKVRYGRQRGGSLQRALSRSQAHHTFLLCQSLTHALLALPLQNRKITYTD